MFEHVTMPLTALSPLDPLSQAKTSAYLAATRKQNHPEPEQKVILYHRCCTVEGELSVASFLVNYF